MATATTAPGSMYLGDISGFPHKLLLPADHSDQRASDRMRRDPLGAHSGLAGGESQAQGGRNGGLAVWACNGLLKNDTGRLPSSDGERIKKVDVSTIPKQLIEHVAI